EARREQLALHHRVDAGRRDPAVAPQRDAPGAFLGQERAGRAAQIGHEIVGEVGVAVTADVVFAKDSRVHWGLLQVKSGHSRSSRPDCFAASTMRRTSCARSFGITSTASFVTTTTRSRTPSTPT